MGWDDEYDNGYDDMGHGSELIFPFSQYDREYILSIWTNTLSGLGGRA